MFAFFLVLFLLLTIYGVTVTSKEGFQTMEPPSHQVVIPTHKFHIPSPDTNPSRTADMSKVAPSSLPGSLPVAAYEQIAAMSPLPYQDTTLVKANRQQLISLLEQLKGFLAFEAQELSERSDPSIQLPLQSARSDFHTLQSEVEVLNRNPGLQPTLTLTNVNEIGSNLAYLQQQVRLIGAAGTLQGPVYEFTEEGFMEEDAVTEEGFKKMMKKKVAAATKAATTKAATTKGAATKPATIKAAANASQPAAVSTKQAAGQIATLEDLKAFIARIQGEILRLSASGTNDPIMASRVTALTKMKSDIQAVISQVEAGTLMAVEIPIMKNDIDKALPILGKPSEPLPQLIKTLRLPAGLANALPSNVQNDPNTMQQINSLINKYADQIINGISASFSVKYTSANEAALGAGHGHGHGQHTGIYEENHGAIAKASKVDKTGFPSMADLNNVSNTKFMPMDTGIPITDRLAPLPMDAGRAPAHFDWKQRAKEIEDQVKKRGLRSSDYGIMAKGTKLSNEFSWKGYARMICTRLQADADPGLPETCGCPPMDWKGWRGPS